MTLPTSLTAAASPPPADSDLIDESLALQAVDLAGQLLVEAQANQTPAERDQGAKIAGMMDDPAGKALTMALSDQAFRSHNPARIADQIRHLLRGYGIPRYFSLLEQAALKVGSVAGQFLPGVVVPAIVARLRQETRAVILPAEEGAFRPYLHERRAQGTRLNINQLGEAILGEEEAGRRLEAYLELLARPEIEYISVKISSIFSQINLVAYQVTLEKIKDRLRTLYRQAMRYQFEQANGRRLPKFVNLDMEEYRDLHLTLNAFTQVLDEPEFQPFRAGIVLQAYLPDAFPAQRSLTDWAIQRVAAGGAPIKVRIVKGANLAMEKVEAAWHGWEQAPYRTKEEVDANFRRMVTYGCRPGRVEAVNLGVASHNLFDMAYALLLQEKFGVQDYVEFEMLEGMANHQARVVKEKAGGLLLYAPVVKKEDFHSAIAYLIRRLDENTAPENFLHDLFGLEVGSEKWEKQKNLFLNAYRRMGEVAEGAQRRQNRLDEAIGFNPEAPFANIPDTDFSLPANQQWIREIRDRWQTAELPAVPLRIGGRYLGPDHGEREATAAGRVADGHDPARAGEVSYRYAQASQEEIDQALKVAREARAAWSGRPVPERKALLAACGEALARRRGDLIGAMMRDGGKRPEEADVEVSEAIDFANYYARSLDLAGPELADCELTPFGTVLVTPPWNFPLAIPCGGVLASLMAGNVVILKPAPEAVLVGWELCRTLWEAGISPDVLQFVPTSDDEVGRALVTDDRVDAVILTGAYATGRMFLHWKPSLHLLGETSGKNSLIITAMADHDQAIKDLVKSAFGHNGQKCSAASLAVLEAEVYDNPTFLRQLRDAAASLKVGPQWDLDSMVTPVIRAPGPELCRAQTLLDPGESWLLEPKMIDGNPNLWSPGIKLGVKRGSWYHQTECFGPVLGLIRARDLDEAIDIVNDSEFGLTGGLHSLDDREIARWRERIEVGNAYINRGTTGAIVQRQPFGGWKKSAFGYAKAGGPNYVLSLGTWQDRPVEKGDEGLEKKAQKSYAQAWESHFSREHDPSQVLGESNHFRYRPIAHLILRLEPRYDPIEARLAMLAADTCGVPYTISVAADAAPPAGHLYVVEPEWTFSQNLAGAERVRILGDPVSDTVRQAAAEVHVRLVDDPVVSNGRLELRHYLREQAVTQTTHRYGNILPPPMNGG